MFAHLYDDVCQKKGFHNKSGLFGRRSKELFIHTPAYSYTHTHSHTHTHINPAYEDGQYFSYCYIKKNARLFNVSKELFFY